MKKVFLSILFLISANTFAHGPIRQTSTFTAEIDGSAEDVWSIFNEFSDMSWHPLVLQVDSASGGSKKGAIRTITLKSGGQLVQKIKKHDAKKMFLKVKTPTKDMTIVDNIEFKGEKSAVRTLPLSNLLDQIKVVSLGDNKAKILWKAAYIRGYMNNLTPNVDHLPELDESAANAAIKKYVGAGILGILKKFNKNATEDDVNLCFTTIPGQCPF
ncbi:MAG: SRPBCC family protein [Methylococcales bacterium]|nr:SRPBCC family protein [Methylococcales bacterium]